MTKYSRQQYFRSSNSKCSALILTVPWPFVISRFHYTTFQEACCKQSLFLIAYPNTCKKRPLLQGGISGDML